ncbi:MAG: hypothetical protein EAZ70_07835 [Runella slithyformis]|nr:MAG: hypothetical protein EAY79_07380 [Runella slithyformis]TAF97089.1 MAG: hypothetical protein EAZ46_03105 [Runella sp.]TAG21571.1 MAG: hypothetical protein EAZ38_07675 [Cytophagales bacterium]TAF27100.1 MAG: hypothetical protein EAZ70_07835 [Runella slithyformis]TAF45525.1 MAG: hypothetical protein EAZ63_10830 [Runella slithyformis]
MLNSSNTILEQGIKLCRFVENCKYKAIKLAYAGFTFWQIYFLFSVLRTTLKKRSFCFLLGGEQAGKVKVDCF